MTRAALATRRAKADALRDMMREGVSPRRLLLSGVGVSPSGLARLGATAKLDARGGVRPA